MLFGISSPGKHAGHGSGHAKPEYIDEIFQGRVLAGLPEPWLAVYSGNHDPCWQRRMPTGSQDGLGRLGVLQRTSKISLKAWASEVGPGLFVTDTRACLFKQSVKRTSWILSYWSSPLGPPVLPSGLGQFLNQGGPQSPLNLILLDRQKNILEVPLIWFYLPWLS